MPSWSTRPSQPGSNVHPDFLSASTSSSGSHTPINDRRPAPPYPPLVGVPSLSSEAAGLPPPTLHSPGGSSSRRSLGHSRSISHPFPSFLSGGGRRADRRGGGGGDDLYDEAGNIVSDVDVEVLPTMHHTGPKGSGRKNTQPEDVDFLTGNCATCDSTVRWPRTLDVYRCTVCQMVNDLKPGGVARDSAAPGLQKVARKGM
jgi:E3 ubiquitin-protein ligase HECTD2